MSSYLNANGALWPTEAGQYDVKDRLPTGTYTIGIHPERGFFLKPITEFRFTGKVYGKTPKQAERILNSFNDRPNSTGVLLTGEKGSGKTMLAKLISQYGAEQGISTIVINAPYIGDDFNRLIQSIDEPCVIIFDEFEKVFDEEEQAATLTLLDGVYPSKKLFILTVNDQHRVSSHLKNRPGRIFYMLEYRGLDDSFIREYCQDCLNNKEYIEQIIRMVSLFGSFNFDMLKALVEEMNRYDETPVEALEMLNVKPHGYSSQRFNICVTIDGEEVKLKYMNIDHITGSPISRDSIAIWNNSSDDEGNDNFEFDLTVTQEDLQKIDVEKGIYTYVTSMNGKGTAKVVFTRDDVVKRNSYSWLDAF